MKDKIQIAVIGDSEAKGRLYKLAEEVGREIAKAGAVLVCGGLGGVMEAGAKGANEQRGLTIGILPGFDKTEANDYIDVKVVTAMSHARNAIIARSADALIVVGGEFGTLSEVALALKIGKPVVVLRGSKVISQLKNKVAFAGSSKEAVKLALDAARR